MRVTPGLLLEPVEKRSFVLSLLALLTGDSWVLEFPGSNLGGDQA